MSEDWETIYAVARYNGVSHNEALKSVAEGVFRCWCGRTEKVCAGGARRLIGCPVSWGAPSLRARSGDALNAGSGARDTQESSPT